MGAACARQPLQGNGNDGFDYGPKSLAIGWGGTPPSGYNAGAFVPGKYLDCIGIVVNSYSATKIVFTFGCQYALYPKLASGDSFLMQVAGATMRGKVA